MKADYHLHTEFSDDSTELMEAQIERAIELGFNEICFTDHVDYGTKKDWTDGELEYRGGDGIGTPVDLIQPLVNVDYPAYFDKLHRMKAIYGGRITIKQGLEFGVQTHTIPQFEKLFRNYESELDFILLSMHQVNNKELWTQDFQKDYCQKDYNELYYKELYEVMKSYKNYSILAHLGLIVRYDLQGRYPFKLVEDQVAEILKLAIKDGKGIELNTSTWHYGLDDTMPSGDILDLYRDLGGKIVTIGSDGHTTKYLGDHYDDAVRILKEKGFTELATYDRMNPVFHPL